jgi:hypothetical protein
MSIKPIRVEIVAVDKMTAGLRLVNRRISALTAPIRDFNRSMGKLGEAAGIGRLADAAGRVNKSFRGLTDTAKSIGTHLTLIGGAAAAGMWALVNGAAQAGDSLDETSRKLGLSVEALQQFQFVAKRSGIDTDAFASSFGKFTKVAGDAAAGVKSSRELFNALGISLRDTHGKLKSTEEIFLEVSDAMHKIPDAMSRNRVAMALFGKTGIAMTEVLGNGRAELEKGMARAREFGLVTTADAAASGKFCDSVDDLKSAFGGLRNTFAGALIPVLTEFNSRLVGMVIQYRPKVRAFAEEFAAKLPGRLTAIRDGVVSVTNAFKPLWKVFKGITDTFGLGNTIVAGLAVVLGTQLVVAIGSLVASLGVLSGVLLTSPVGWVALGVAGLGAAILGTYMALRKLRAEAQQQPPKVQTVEAAEKEKKLAAAGNLRQIYLDQLRSSGKLTSTPDLMQAEADARAAGIDLSYGADRERVTQINDLYNSLSGARALPTAGAAIPRAGKKSESTVTVKFDNLPKGTRVSSSGNAPLTLDMGYGMVTP